ncbi:MAG: multicopper oxidase domain-containing protein [Bacteroidetes bacterium]|nr:multicopper oxidase domain-containing protein [Bacteroidota bacterium]
MQKKLVAYSLFVIALTATNQLAALSRDTIYINRGFFTTVDTISFPYLAFNKTTTFNNLNTVLRVEIYDTLELTVVNNDSIPHGFDLKGVSGYKLGLFPGASATVKLSSNLRKAICYFDPTDYPLNRYMGLAGMICFDDFGNKKTKRFYWNLKDHDSTYNKIIPFGATVDFNTYYPNYFTINGLSFPQLQNDTTAVINGKIGDTIRIFCLNSGQSSHSIHFHGFHTKAIYHSQIFKIDWEKDTWGTPSMETMVLEFVPDKSGKYSVHDHNLVAVSGGGVHPNGMFIIMSIQ